MPLTVIGTVKLPKLLTETWGEPLKEKGSWLIEPAESMGTSISRSPL